MTTPALNIPVRATGLDEFKSQMTQTSALAGTALRAVTAQVIKMNAGFLASQGAAGAATLAFGRVLGILGPITLGITAISDAFKLMNYATDLAKQKIAEWTDLADKANKSGFSTEFFQRITKAGGTAAESIDQLTEAMGKFNEASTPKLGGSDLQKRLDELTGAGNFKGNTGLQKLGFANDTEQRLRAIVDLINQAVQSGQREAAIDLASTAFGPKVAAALQADSNYLNQMLQRADAISKTDLISDADIGRAIELKTRMDAAQQTLADKWKPIQADLASLGMNYQQSWVEVYEVMAKAVTIGNDLYAALKGIPDLFAQAGSAPFWNKLTEFTGKLGLNSDPASLGIVTDPKEVAKLGASDKLRAALQNHGNVSRAMQQATDVQSAVRGDTSKDPAKQHDAPDANDPVDRAINQLRKHTEEQQADTKAIGLGDAALAQFRAQAAETAAVQANGGKETAEQAAQFKILQERAAAAADAMAKAKVANEISFGNKTAFLSQQDAAIAEKLKGIYGDDVPRALASSEAASLRLNDALKSVSSTIESNLTTGLTNMLSSTQSVGTGFRNMARSIVSSLEQMVIKMAVVEPLMRTFQSSFGGSALSLFGGGSSSSVAGATMSTGLGAGTGGLSFPMFAGGTDSAPGGLAWVGERGPELVNLPKGSQVIPNHVSTRLMQNIPGYADGGVIGGGSPAPIFGDHQTSFTMGDIHVHTTGQPGTPSANRDLAQQIIGQVREMAGQLVGNELRTQMRPGGILSGRR